VKRAAWVTDIHLNFLRPHLITAFFDMVAATRPDAVLVGGDIGEADDVADLLSTFEASLRRPIYFILGNHDFYHGSIAQVRGDVAALTQTSPWLQWLPIAGVVELTPETGLVGHDGWADGRFGDYARSDMELNDYVLIAELAGLDRAERLAKMNALGDQAAAHLGAHVPQALERYRHLVVLTHVPPFREACWHKGQISDDNALPHFACKAVGDVLLEIMRAHPTHTMTVLCGHTHSAGVANILPNLVVKTGAAAYGRPQLQEVLVIP
jgi:predicted MPP superfamily phosphohydrolase